MQVILQAISEMENGKIHLTFCELSVKFHRQSLD